MEMNRLEILQKIESGELSVEEGFRLLSQLDALAGGGTPPHTDELGELASDQPPNYTEKVSSVGEVPPNKEIPELKGYRIWSWLLFGLFLLLTGISTWWMISAWQRNPFGVGFWVSWIPFLIGVLGMANSFNARWLHLRVTEKKKGEWKSIRISIPLPLGLAVWVLKANPKWLPSGMRDKDLGESLRELNKSITRDQPFYIEVDEEDEHVEIYIG